MALVSIHQESDRRRLDQVRLHLGNELCARLEDPDVMDVMLNDGKLFEDRKSVGLIQVGTMTTQNAMSLIGIIASEFDAVVNRSNPVFEGELPIRKARFVAFVPPLSATPSFSIRLPALSIYTFTDYVAGGIMTQNQSDVLDEAMRLERNTLIAGGTQSGKSTLLNALLEAYHRYHPDKRVGIIEAITELQCSSNNMLALHTNASNDEQELLRRLMRARPDAIVLGEVRDKAALTLVKAANTGHQPILSTVHANSATSGFRRMEQLVAEALPGVPMREQIADALDLIVSIVRIDPRDRTPNGPSRKLIDILQIDGVIDGTISCTKLA